MPARAMGIGSGRPPAEAASMFKDLLVPVVLGEVSTEAFEVACTLAAHDGGRVTGLVALSAVTPVVGAMNYFPEAVYDSLREAVLGASERLREQVDACLARGDVAWESHVAESIWLTSPESAVLHAHYADLVVPGRVANATVDAERAVFSRSEHTSELQSLMRISYAVFC